LNKLTLYQLYVKVHRKCTQTYSDNQFYDNIISACWFFCCTDMLRQTIITSSILPKGSDSNLVHQLFFQGVIYGKKHVSQHFLISYLTIYGHRLQPISKYEET